MKAGYITLPRLSVLTAFILAAAFIILVCPPPTLAGTCNKELGKDDISDYWLPFYINDQWYKIPCSMNTSLVTPSTDYKRAIIVIHGCQRNAVDYFEDVNGIVHTAGKLAETIVVAPQFVRSDPCADDVSSADLDDDVIYWYKSGWATGYDSNHIDIKMSSFAVVDEIIRRLEENFSNLSQVVVIGHSAGGQFVNRYAAGTEAPEQILHPNDIDIRYIVANPSSYLYLNKERWKKDTDPYEWEEPNEPNCLYSYNYYRYGLQAMSGCSYMNNANNNGPNIPVQYQQREVIYLLGDKDTGTGNLDMSCKANVQGKDRFERGTVYYEYLKHIFNNIGLMQRKCVVTDGEHDHHQMFDSAYGKEYMLYALSKPMNVTADDGASTTNVQVTWNSVSGATSYHVLRATSPWGPWAMVASFIPGTSFTDTPPIPGTTYLYSVMAVNTTRTSARSPYDAGWRKLSTPTSVTASDGGSTSNVQISWTPVNGGTHYGIWRDRYPSGSSKDLLNDNNWDSSSPYNDTTAVPGLTYYYWVQAGTSSSGGAHPSNLSSSDSGWRRLMAPTNVSATDGDSTDHVQITWSHVTGATHYGIWRDTSSSGSSKELLTGTWDNASPYNDTEAEPETTYYYWVQAGTSSGGAHPGSLSSSNSGWRRLKAPTNVSATDGTDINKVEITWSVVTGANYYRVYFATASDGSRAVLGGWDNKLSRDHTTSATPGKTYYYWVKASTTSNDSRTSHYSSFNSGWRRLKAPTGVSATDGTYRDKVRISWTGVTGASHYGIWCDSSSAGSSKELLNEHTWDNASPFDDTTATPKTTYYYWIQAGTSADGAHAGDLSSSDSGWRKIPLSPPTNVSATKGTKTDYVQITWGYVEGATNYKAWRATSPTATKTPLGGEAWSASRSYRDEQATPGVTYYYWVKAATSSTGDEATDYSASDTGWRKLLPPETVSASDGTYSDKITISWDIADGAHYYRLHYGTAQFGQKSPLSGWQSERSYTHNSPPVVPGDTHYYWVEAAVNSNGDRPSDISDPAAPGWAKLLPPTGVSASDGAFADKVRITWAGVTGAHYYEVYRATSPTGSKEALSDWQANSPYHDTTATPGVTYYYWVKAACNWSGWRATDFSSPDTGWSLLSVGFQTAASDGLETTTPAKINVALSYASGTTVTVDYAATGGSANNTVDYNLPAGTLTFDPGDTTETIDVNIIYDGSNEPDETIQLTLSNVTGLNVVLGALTQHTYTILDNKKYSVCPDGSGDFTTIQDGIDGISTRDVIELCDATYTGNKNRNIDYKGKAITVRSKSGNPQACIIDLTDVIGGPHDGFNFISDEGRDSILQGVTVTNGAYGVVCGKKGGFFPPYTSYSGSPTIINCIITGNSGGGGGFGGSSAYSGGGMLCIEDSTPLLIDCTFSENSAGGAGLGFGADPNGGGLNCRNSSPTLHNCSFIGNTASGGGGLGISVAIGGGMHCSGGTPTLTDCVFIDNSAKNAAGGFGCLNSRPAFTNCIFSGNSTGSGPMTGGQGGGAACVKSSPTFNNCTFSRNTAMNGGGIYIYGAYIGNASAASCTFYGNSAYAGGGIYIQNSSPIAVTNTIIAFSTQGEAVRCYSAGATLTCCDVYGNAGGDWVGCIAGQNAVRNNISLNPMFCSPANEDFTLRSGSPCDALSPPNEQCGLIGAWPVGCSGPATTTVCPDGSGDYTKIQDAIVAATYGDIIELCDATYTGTGNRDIDFLGKAITVRSQSGNPQACIIDCQANAVNPHRGFKFVSGEGPDSMLQGVTITNGYVPSSWPDYEGGAVRIKDSSPTLINCIISDSECEGQGGGVCVGSSAFPTFTGCTFSGNTAGDDGGGLSSFGVVALNRCTFHDNHTPAHGGGMSNMGIAATLTNCLFSGNSAGTDGGGLATFSSDVVNLTNCTFAFNSGPTGGGIYVGSATTPPEVSNTIIAFSTQGQAVACGSGSIALDFCNVFGNAGGDWVGCIAGQQPNPGNISTDPYFVAVPTVPMTSYWKFDENAGAAAGDSANGNDGTISGATWTTGKVGSALYFHGSSSDSVTVPHSTNLNITGPFTAEAWIKATGSSNYLMIADKYYGSATVTKGLSLYLSSGKLRLSIYSGANGGKNVIGTSELRDNAWHHVAGLWDGSVAKVYVDGAMQKDSPWSYPPASTTAALGIGKRLGGWGGYLPFLGTIDEVAIYNRALETDEIQQHYQDGLAGLGYEDTPLGGDYHLLPESLCIDIGDSNAVPPSAATDLDGKPRFIDGDCDDAEIVDLGAYEFAHVGDFNFDGDIDLVDFAIFGMAWSTEPADEQWNPICDIDTPADNSIDMPDFDVFVENYLLCN